MAASADRGVLRLTSDQRHTRGWGLDCKVPWNAVINNTGKYALISVLESATDAKYYALRRYGATGRSAQLCISKRLDNLQGRVLSRP